MIDFQRVLFLLRDIYFISIGVSLTVSFVYYMSFKFLCKKYGILETNTNPIIAILVSMFIAIIPVYNIYQDFMLLSDFKTNMYRDIGAMLIYAEDGDYIIIDIDKFEKLSDKLEMILNG